jgi:4-alpha-glucanotransferase
MEKKLGKAMPFQKRSGGVLLPVFSLPSLFGMGDFGPGAFRFLEMIHSLGLRYWHILPLGPTEVGRGNSPYSASSAFALNPLFVSPEEMLSQGLAEYGDFGHIPAFPRKKVAYSTVEAWKNAFLRRTWERNRHSQILQQEIKAFAAAHSHWLEAYTLFSSLKKRNCGSSWNLWEHISPEKAMEEEELLQEEAAYEQYVQYLLFQQWKKLHDYAKSLGIMVLGDMPFYVDYDSADVWTNRELFLLDEKGSPLVVAGVPPDYYSKTGQRWGNPIYNWDTMKSRGYSWWIARVRHALEMCDALRLDHFRGFSAYWEIEASRPNAVEGRWRASPGQDLFEHFQETLGNLPFFAEDLGVITQEVRDLRNAWGFPGMEILHFAFENYAENPYALHNHSPSSVVFTATHDNNTSRGWYLEDLSPSQRREVSEICGRPLGEGNVHRVLVEMALESVARTAIIPFQDILGLGSSGRINIPSTGSGNWAWSLSPEEMALSPDQRRWFSRKLLQAGRR